MPHGKPRAKWHTMRALGEISELIDNGKLGEASAKLKPFIGAALETEIKSRVHLLHAELMLAKGELYEALLRIKLFKKHFCGRDLARAIEIERTASEQLVA